MHMNIHTHSGFVESLDENEVGRFTAHSLELEQFVDFVGYVSVIRPNQFAGDPQDGCRLGFVETCRVDEFFDLGLSKSKHPFGRVGPFEEPEARNLGYFVFGSQTQNRGDQDFVWGTTGSLGNQGNGRSGPILHVLFDRSDHSTDRSVVHEWTLLLGGFVVAVTFQPRFQVSCADHAATAMLVSDYEGRFVDVFIVLVFS